MLYLTEDVLYLICMMEIIIILFMHTLYRAMLFSIILKKYNFYILCTRIEDNAILAYL